MVTLTINGMEGVDKSLGLLPMEIRRTVLNEGMRDASKAVVRRAKELVPRPGYPGDKKGIKPLRDTLTYVLRDYGEVLVAVVGSKTPGGRHGHLVEKGHDIVRGGTKEKPGKLPGINAAGRRWIESQGYTSRGRYWYDSEGRKAQIGRKLLGMNSRGARVIVTVRGLGEVIGRVQPNPYLEPASRDTVSEQNQAVTASIAKAITKSMGITA